MVIHSNDHANNNSAIVVNKNIINFFLFSIDNDNITCSLVALGEM